MVGAGPGDPDLITVKGLACLRQADVVIYDYLVNCELLANLQPHCELIARGKHAQDQDELNCVMAKRAEQGKTVVRLKSGDPFLFGRGGEEAECLAAGGIPFEVVPGVTSAFAAPASAGIPLTHRSVSSSVAIITGHETPDKANSAVRWDLLGEAVDTLVILMGLKNLPTIVDRLLQAGKSADTPIAVISRGTLPDQMTIVSTLGQVVDEACELQPPALIVVGKVVRLRENLAPFETCQTAWLSIRHLVFSGSEKI